MSRHQRAQSSTEGHKEPHSVSLKVLRLSRPSLAHQYPLPQSRASDALEVPTKAALSYPSNNPDDLFILSPLLTLPPAFGAAYVGESFSCTLCANNELEPCSDGGNVVTSVQISAEIVTPSLTVPLELATAVIADVDPAEVGSSLEPGKSLQKIVRHDLKEEGNHVLAVTVTYTEPCKPLDVEQQKEPGTAGTRIRTFRKLYQFIAQQCLAVRTKSGDLPPLVTADGRGGSTKARLVRYVLEAQLENMGETPICLENVVLVPKSPFKSTSLNWDMPSPVCEGRNSPILNARDVTQVAFLLEQQTGDSEGDEALRKDLARDGRAILGQLSIEWRSGMGDRGSLSTGWLTSRRR
ncbi:hypothetical protein GP486_005812 [Trichoglossum hirsutum]|uniref:DUF974 domain-containing protein n=1 Tax=Trichoglossum hirsutum TaxID=265104 RepID=A0A9P8RLJ7_9PEZI|nr:hypothetical protein GP486_005812 [Trichoglossum hirsutum]